MKLDRNINRGGRGKYALVNMRKLIPLLDAVEENPSGKAETFSNERGIVGAFKYLLEQGIISLGNETPGDQFFVMKYKDKFAAPALQAYAVMVSGEVDRMRARGLNVEAASLKEFAHQMANEARAARELGNRIPD